MGYLRQFLPASIKPIGTGMVVFGKAMPVLEADVFSERLIVSGDRDGVVVIPQLIQHEVFNKALEKARGEKKCSRRCKRG